MAKKEDRRKMTLTITMSDEDALRAYAWLVQASGQTVNHTTNAQKKAFAEERIQKWLCGGTKEHERRLAHEAANASVTDVTFS